MRVLIFGDSITQGFWGTDGGWVNDIRKHYDSLQLSDLDGRDEPTVFNLGISADNSENILRRIEAETVARTRHNNLPVVAIQIGVNDSSTEDQPDGEGVGLSIENYEQNLRQIIDIVRPLSSKIIFVGLSACDEKNTMPVSWGSFYYTNNAIKSYENKMKEIAEEYGIAFIPVFDKFKEELDKGADFLPDGLHPNNAGHTFISQIVLNKLDSLLV